MKISTLICVYKNDNIGYFIEACNSVLNQTLQPSQIVLVIDGPIPDKLKTCIHKFKANSVNLNIEFKDIWLRENMGHGYARSEGVKGCEHELIALADADDINHLQRFEKQVEFMINHQEISIVGSQILEIECDTKDPIGERRVPLSNNEIIMYLQARCPFNQMSVMFRKKDILLSGNYVSFFHNEDYYLWIRMYLKGCKFANLPEVLVNARVNEKFYSRRGGLKYFLSELKIQNLMLEKKIIALPQWFLNVTPRLIIQVLLPSSIRGHLFKLLFRSNKKSNHA